MSTQIPTPDGMQIAKAGTVVGNRPTLNLIEGSNVTLTVTDNAGTQAVDVTVASSGGGGGGSPSGPAGGSLAGAYPNPSIAVGAVGGTEMAPLTGPGVLGNPATTAVHPSIIGASADGQALVRVGGTLGFALPGGDLTGLFPVPTVAKASKSFALPGSVTANIVADSNDLNPSGLADATILRANVTASVHLTGLAGGTNGRLLGLVNVGTATLTIAAEGAGSVAANRFAFTQTLSVGAGLFLLYDGTVSRWRPLAPLGSGGSGVGYVVHVYDTPGDYVWTKPAGAIQLDVICIGAGAGGASGRIGAVSTNRGGGGGGGGGGFSRGTFAATLAGATENIKVQAGTPGAASQGTGNNNGNDSSGPLWYTTFGALVRAFGDAGASGGTGAAGPGGGGGEGTFPGSLGGTGHAGSVTGGEIATLGAGGGGGGGGIGASNTYYYGGDGGKSRGPLGPSSTSYGGSSQGAAGLNGNGFPGFYSAGGGGAGGAGGGGGLNGGNGGHGAIYGGGGGGGGGSVTGTFSGKGGDGAGGLVVVTTYIAL